MYYLPFPYLFVSFFFISSSLPECRQMRGVSPNTVVSGRRQTIEFWKWHGTRQRWLPPSVFRPIRTPWADCPLFQNSISRNHAAKQWKIHSTMFPHQCLMSSLWPPPPVLLTHMNMEDEYRPTSEVTPNSTRDRLVNHEIAFTEVAGTNLDWLEALYPWEISWPLFYVRGHKDQAKCYHNKQYKGKWRCIILFNSSLDIYHHSLSILD